VTDAEPVPVDRDDEGGGGSMPLELSGDVEVTRDRSDRVTALDHLRQPFAASAGAQANLVDLADEYLQEVAPIYGIASVVLRQVDVGVAASGRPDPSEPDRLVRADVVPLPDGSGTVAYGQRHANLEVWEAGIAVTTLAGPLRVVSSRSTYHHDIKLANAGVLERFRDAGAEATDMSGTRVGDAMGMKGRPRQQIRTHATRLLVYREFCRTRRPAAASRCGGPVGSPTGAAGVRHDRGGQPLRRH
jgi:hypothetical protein